jgi:hypothetical protein
MSRCLQTLRVRSISCSSVASHQRCRIQPVEAIMTGLRCTVQGKNGRKCSFQSAGCTAAVLCRGQPRGEVIAAASGPYSHRRTGMSHSAPGVPSTDCVAGIATPNRLAPLGSSPEREPSHKVGCWGKADLLHHRSASPFPISSLATTSPRNHRDFSHPPSRPGARLLDGRPPVPANKRDRRAMRRERLHAIMGQTAHLQMNRKATRAESA